MPDLTVRTCTQYWVFLHNNCSKLPPPAHGHTSQRRHKKQLSTVVPVPVTATSVAAVHVVAIPYFRSIISNASP